MRNIYRYVLIQSYRAQGEQSKHRMRARPMPGQGLETSMRVECSAEMREAHPEATIFKVVAKVKDSEWQQHIYTSWQWAYEILTPEQADDFIECQQWDAPDPNETNKTQDLSMDFSNKHDGLERTPWFQYARHLPVRDGYYEIRPWKGAPDTRCQWRGNQWWASDRLAHRLQVFDWRGLTRESYKAETKRLRAGSADA